MCQLLELKVGDCEHFSVTFEGEREEHSLLCICQTYELKVFMRTKETSFSSL